MRQWPLSADTTGYICPWWRPLQLFGGHRSQSGWWGDHDLSFELVLKLTIAKWSRDVTVGGDVLQPGAAVSWRELRRRALHRRHPSLCFSRETCEGAAGAGACSTARWEVRRSRGRHHSGCGAWKWAQLVITRQMRLFCDFSWKNGLKITFINILCFYWRFFCNILVDWLRQVYLNRVEL